MPPEQPQSPNAFSGLMDGVTPKDIETTEAKLDKIVAGMASSSPEDGETERKFNFGKTLTREEIEIGIKAMMGAVSEPPASPNTEPPAPSIASEPPAPPIASEPPASPNTEPLAPPITLGSSDSGHLSPELKKLQETFKEMMRAVSEPPASPNTEPPTSSNIEPLLGSSENDPDLLERVDAFMASDSTRAQIRKLADTVADLPDAQREEIIVQFVEATKEAFMKGQNSSNHNRTTTLPPRTTTNVDSETGFKGKVKEFFFGKDTDEDYLEKMSDENKDLILKRREGEKLSAEELNSLLEANILYSFDLTNLEERALKRSDFNYDEHAINGDQREQIEKDRLRRHLNSSSWMRKAVYFTSEIFSPMMPFRTVRGEDGRARGRGLDKIVDGWTLRSKDQSFKGKAKFIASWAAGATFSILTPWAWVNRGVTWGLAGTRIVDGLIQATARHWKKVKEYDGESIAENIEEVQKKYPRLARFAGEAALTTSANGIYGKVHKVINSDPARAFSIGAVDGRIAKFLAQMTENWFSSYTAVQIDNAHANGATITENTVRSGGDSITNKPLEINPEPNPPNPADSPVLAHNPVVGDGASRIGQNADATRYTEMAKKLYPEQYQAVNSDRVTHIAEQLGNSPLIPDIGIDLHVDQLNFQADTYGELLNKLHQHFSQINPNHWQHAVPDDFTPEQFHKLYPSVAGTDVNWVTADMVRDATAALNIDPHNFSYAKLIENLSDMQDPSGSYNNMAERFAILMKEANSASNAHRFAVDVNPLFKDFIKDIEK